MTRRHRRLHHFVHVRLLSAFTPAGIDMFTCRLPVRQCSAAGGAWRRDPGCCHRPDSYLEQLGTRPPPHLPGVLLHTALITAGLRSLTACGAIVRSLRVDYMFSTCSAAPHAKLHIPSPFNKRQIRAPAGTESKQTCQPASLPSSSSGCFYVLDIKR